MKCVVLFAVACLSFICDTTSGTLRGVPHPVMSHITSFISAKEQRNTTRLVSRALNQCSSETYCIRAKKTLMDIISQQHEEGSVSNETIDAISQLYLQQAQRVNLSASFWVTFYRFIFKFALSLPLGQKTVLSKHVDHVNSRILERFVSKHLTRHSWPTLLSATEDKLTAVDLIIRTGDLLRGILIRSQNEEELRNIVHHVRLIGIFSNSFPNVPLVEANHRFKNLQEYNVKALQASGRVPVRGCRALSISRDQYLQIETQFLCSYCESNAVSFSQPQVIYQQFLLNVVRTVLLLCAEERPDLLRMLICAIGPNVQHMIVQVRARGVTGEDPHVARITMQQVDRVLDIIISENSNF